jgi:hypothetical protein
VVEVDQKKMYLTRKQLKKVKAISLRKKIMKKVRFTIIKNLFFKNKIFPILKVSDLFVINLENFNFYLLEKLKTLNKVFYFKFLRIFDKNLLKNNKYLYYLEYNCLLYNLLWDNVKVFDDFLDPSSLFKYFKLKLPSLYNFQVKNLFIKFKNLFKNPKTLSNIVINFKESLIADFEFFLKPIQIKLESKVKNSTLISVKWLQDEIKKLDDLDGINRSVYPTHLEKDFEDKFEKSLEEIDPEEFGGYKDYFNVIAEKKSDFIIFPKKKIIEKLYIEDCFINNSNFNLTPYKYINIESYKALLSKSMLPEDCLLQLKLAHIHNTNLEFFNIPYDTFNMALLPPLEFNSSKYNNYVIYEINKLEKSKIFIDLILTFEFSYKSVINFIELFLYKFKSVLDIEKLFKLLYINDFNIYNFIEFYNTLVIAINEIKLNFTLYTINFVLDFLDFLYTLLINFNLYENILNFSIIKVKSIFSKLNIFNLYYIKRFLLFEFNNDFLYINFLYNIFSNCSLLVNNNYYACANYNNYLMVENDYLIYNSLIKDINLQKDIYFYFEEFFFYEELRHLSSLVRFDIRHSIYKTHSLKFKKINFRFFDLYALYIFDKVSIYMTAMNGLNFSFKFIEKLNIYKYRLSFLYDSLSNAFLNSKNFEFILDNIVVLKLHPFYIFNNIIKIRRIILDSVLKDTNYKNYNYIDIWDLINPSIHLTNLTIEERVALFTEYSNFILIVFFNNAKLYEKYVFRVVNFIYQFTNDINFVKYKKEIKNYYKEANVKYLLEELDEKRMERIKGNDSFYLLN